MGSVQTQTQTPTEKSDREFAFAKKLYEDKLYSLAATQFADFVKKFPNHEYADQALYLSGHSFYAQGQFKQAFEAFKELELAYPQSGFLPQSRFQLAKCQLELGEPGAAAELFKRVSIFHPDNELAIAASLESARAYSQAGEPEKSLKEYFRVIEEYGESTAQLEAYLEIVQIYLKQGRYQEAIRQTDAIFNRYGAGVKDKRIYLLRARLFYELGQHDEAESIYQALVDDFPNTEEAQDAQFQLASLQKRRGNFNLALDNYERLSKMPLKPTLRDQVLIDKAEVLISLQRFDEALASLNAVESGEDCHHMVQSSYRKAQIYLQLNDPESAERALEQVLARNGSIADTSCTPMLREDAYFLQVEILRQRQDYRRAYDFAEEYLRTYPRSDRQSEMTFRKAEIAEYGFKDFDRAIRAYDTFIEKHPRHNLIDDAHLAVARCYERLQEFRLAAAKYDKFLSDYPASGAYDWAYERHEAIKNAINLEEASSFARISSLLSDANRGKQGPDWQVKLAKMYYQEKEFGLSIGAFKDILRRGEVQGLKDELYYHLGSSYYYSKLQKDLLEPGLDHTAYLDSAAYSLNYLTSGDSRSQWVEEGLLLLTKIELGRQESDSGKLETLRNARSIWEDRFPGGQHGDFVLLKLAEMTRKNSRADTSASLKALDYFQMLLQDYPDSPYRVAATFGEIQAMATVSRDSVIAARLHDFLNSYPRSRFAPEALMHLARLETSAGDYEGAIRLLNRVREEFYYSDFADRAISEIAHLYFLQGDYRSAIQFFDLPRNGVGNGTPDQSLGFYEARAYHRLGDTGKALTKYIDFIHQNPQSPETPEAMLAVAEIASAQKNTAFAISYYENLIKHADSDAGRYQAYRAMADLFFDQGQYQTARENYLSAVNLAANLGERRYPSSQAIRCRYRLRQYVDADAEVKTFKKQFDETDNEEAQFLFDKGMAHMADKDFEQAKEAFEKLKDDFKKTDYVGQGEFGLGAVLLVTNHTEDALKVLTAIPGRYPHSEVTPKTYFNLGDFYYKSQQIQNAIDAFKRTADHPEAGEYRQKALQYLIKCYNDVRLWDQAIALSRQYIEEYPNADDLFRRRIDIARNLMHLKEYHRAIELYERLLLYADSETEAEIQFYIAESYKEMGDFERATAEYLKVKYLTKPSKLPWHVTALFEAADSLVRRKLPDQAERIYRQIITEEGADSNFGRFARQKLDELTSANSGK